MNLNLPEFDLKLKRDSESLFIFDEIRLKWLSLTPEEWVRQNFIKYLTNHLYYPKNKIGIEQTVNINRLQKRCDILIYDSNTLPLMVIECKAPIVKIDQKVFDQAQRYTTELQLQHIILTNGVKHYYCRKEKDEFKISEQIPDYRSLID
jgi:hypothetical protein